MSLVPLSLVLALAAPPECSEQQPLPTDLFLRRLSLDLRGELPTLAEYEAVTGRDAVPEETIDAWLGSDEFRVAMRWYHEGLLWPNVSNVQLGNGSNVVSPAKGGTIYALIGNPRRKKYRQGLGTEICGDYAQTEYDSQGRPVAQTVVDPNTGTSYQQEGWVQVAPYWAPDTLIKVCAFDAQTALTNFGDACPPDAPTFGPNACVRCDSPTGASSAACGCGENLRWCYSQDVFFEVLDSMRESVLRLADDVATGAAPYSALLLGTNLWVDGRLGFWYEHTAKVSNLQRTYNVPVPSDGDHSGSTYTDPSWRAVARSGVHAGVLTHPAFTLRFQSNRGRANRARSAFTNQYFVPPSGEDTDCDPTTDDLTERCTCRGCHLTLEPLAAYYADVAEAGSGLLTDRVAFPIYDAQCDPDVSPKITLDCSRFYATEVDAPKPGTLRAYQYADDATYFHQQIATNAAKGPRGLAEELIASGAFHEATVSNVATWFLGRPLVRDPSRVDDESALHADWVAAFAADEDFPGLVRRIVTSDTYRRIR